MAQHDEHCNSDIRIGVYICHCGTNISSMIDVKDVAQYASCLPHVVVSRDYKYMCSDPGQALIIEDIKQERLNRVVVASCSPLLHEETFRDAVTKGGLNPCAVTMVNIREHNAWVHIDSNRATDKAKAQVRGAVGRIPFQAPCTKKKVPIFPEVMIVGGGIAGIHAALTLANAGKKVHLVEKEPSIGGHMAKFDKTFPTLDCAACILTPKMSAVKAHPNINLMTYTEVVKVQGCVGNYQVTVRRKPRYIKEDICIGCRECIEACVYKKPNVPDEFNLALSKRKPIYLPFAQATPTVAVIDPEACIQFKSGKCKKTCVEACSERKAIDFDQKEEIEEMKVGVVIIATGFKAFDATRIPYYGYGVYPNVYTSLEVERLLNASGPSLGEVVLRDGSKPKSVGIIHCVGSRDNKTNTWCSRVCCMYSMKLAHMIRERTQSEVFNFYIDIRAPGKGYEEFYEKLLKEGVHFIRGRVAEVTDCAMSSQEEGKMIIRAEDTLAGFVRRIPVDMVVLSVGLEPQPDAQDVRRLFNISCSTEGFFLEKHPKLAPVNTNTQGIFLAGCCQGPKDIPDTVAQAGAAAAEAFSLIDSGYVEVEPTTAFVIEEFCSGCKTCLPLCPYQAIVRDAAKGVAVISDVLCAGCGVCVAACPSGAIRQNLFGDEETFSEIEKVLAND